MKKQNILYFMIISMLLTWMFSACRDYTFENIPDPVVPEDLTPGLKLTTEMDNRAGKTRILVKKVGTDLRG